MTTEPSIFTRIINREVPADFLFEDEDIIVIRDIKPDAPVHLLGISKKPYPNLEALIAAGESEKDLLWKLFSRLVTIAKEQGIAESGYRLLTNTGPDAHQLVPHLHIHLLGGEELGRNIEG